MDNWIDPIKDNVAFNYVYDNWENYKTLLKHGDETAWLEFDKIVNTVAREYDKDVEKKYSKLYDEGYKDALNSMGL